MSKATSHHHFELCVYIKCLKKWGRLPLRPGYVTLCDNVEALRNRDVT